ncbi:MAG: membrane dipeptidase [Clostridia bacterium]|nr:membrane dipeptidase [Clostridia bacterium]
MFLVDSHCDSIQKVDAGLFGLVGPYNFSKKHCQLQFVAMFAAHPGDRGDDSYHRTFRYTGQYCAALASESDKVLPVKCYADIERAFAAGKHGAMLCIESATGLKNSPVLLERLYNVGVRVVGLTWLSNDLAKSNRVLDDGEEDTGLSAMGRDFVKKGNELGILWDVSHASDRTFWDLCELSAKPVIASHSNFRALCPHSRNLTDEMTRRIIADGGMIGLNLAKPFIHAEKSKQTVEQLFAHLDHCLSLGGEDNVGFGFDIDGIECYPTPLTTQGSIHDQLLEMMQTHYSERLVEKVAGENYLAYLKKWL